MKTEYESAALVYLQAMCVRGDRWEQITPDQVRETLKDVEGIDYSATRDTKRLYAVAAHLKSADDARNFSPFWRKIGMDGQK